MNEPADDDRLSQQHTRVSASQVHSRYLMKTIVKTAICIGVAYAILAVFPGATWVLYVVVAFVVISWIWASMLAWAAARERRHARRGPSSGPER